MTIFRFAECYLISAARQCTYDFLRQNGFDLRYTFHFAHSAYRYDVKLQPDIEILTIAPAKDDAYRR